MKFLTLYHSSTLQYPQDWCGENLLSWIHHQLRWSHPVCRWDGGFLDHTGECWRKLGYATTEFHLLFSGSRAVYKKRRRRLTCARLHGTGWAKHDEEARKSRTFREETDFPVPRVGRHASCCRDLRWTPLQVFALTVS